MKQIRLCITGTDTEIGKTFVSVGLMRALADDGQSVTGMKPVATGARESGDGLRNADALALQAAASQSRTYADVNPYVYRAPIAPHFAARQAGEDIRLTRINAAFARIQDGMDAVVVEGVGGWKAPLGSTLTLADVVTANDLSVILVVGLRLGCINHALLSAAAITADGVRFAGWVANTVDPDYQLKDFTISDLQDRIAAPLLAVVPHVAEQHAASGYLQAAARRLTTR